MHCGYLVEAPNSGADTYDFYLQEAAVIEAMLAIETPEQKGTPVPGLWTEAYVGPAVGSPGQFALVALNKGDMAIELRGPNKDVLIALAKLAITRLK